MELDFFYDIVKELYDGDFVVGVYLKEFGEYRGCKELFEKVVKWLNVYIYVCIVNFFKGFGKYSYSEYIDNEFAFIVKWVLFF